MAKEQGKKLIAQNRKARHDYAIDDVYEAGIVLVGTEVKSLRAGRASLVDGYAMVEDGEIWLRGVNIPMYDEGSWTNHTPTRARKLLLNRNEISKITNKMTGKNNVNTTDSLCRENCLISKLPRRSPIFRALGTLFIRIANHLKVDIF